MRDTFVRFRRDRSGNYMVIAALMMPVLIGLAGLATEGGLWLYAHQSMSSAADAAAVSAVNASANVSQEALGIAASYGFVDGANGATVIVNQPPKSGNYTKNPSAVEVVVQQQQTRLFSALFSSEAFSIQARAVAAQIAGCVLALDPSADKTVRVNGSAQVDLKGCVLDDNSKSGKALEVNGTATVSGQAVNVVGGVSGSGSITAMLKTGVSPTADPYASVVQPALGSCNHTGFSADTTAPPLDPGVYCGGISIHNGANVTLNPGVYFLDQGTLSVQNGATISGTGVTIVFTSSTGNMWADAKIDNNATVNLTAPTSGATAGIVIFGDRNDAGTTFKLEGGATQTFGGAVYAPGAQVKFAGGSGASGCMQLIADTVEFTGNANFHLSCAGFGTNTIGSSTAALVE